MHHTIGVFEAKDTEDVSDKDTAAYNFGSPNKLQ